jgi:hypothetical protein
MTIKAIEVELQLFFPLDDSFLVTLKNLKYIKTSVLTNKVFETN